MHLFAFDICDDQEETSGHCATAVLRKTAVLETDIWTKIWFNLNFDWQLKFFASNVIVT